ncbi:Proteinase R [Termitomyces sp. J132]|nr:Proteinase R [Termitomyces sp. J132]
MHLYSILVVSAGFLAPVIAAPGYLVPIEKVDGETSGRHIVSLKANADKSSFIEATNIATTHNWTVINGFAGQFTEDQINVLRAHGDVESITEDGFAQVSMVTTQTNATWGLARLSSVKKLANQNSNALNFQYLRETTAGLGVDVYVIVMPFFGYQVEFGGRARWGATFGGYVSMDKNGHGTHCAGTVAGSSVGVARAASIIAVKVLGDNGISNFEMKISISGLDWVYNQAKTSGRPSIVSMSLSSNSPSTPLDSAVTSLTTIGVHAVSYVHVVLSKRKMVQVAAGNNNLDATNMSPARASGAITVGATNIADSRASFSNYGSVVALFAPGENIISTWFTGPTALVSLSGTSMPIWLICNASKIGVGAMYGQGPSWQKCWPAGFMSKKFTNAQQNYAMHKLETLAIVEALLRWEDKLLEYKIHVITDHKALEFLKTQQDLSPHQQWWMDYMLRFNFDITYIIRELNKVADCLSCYFESRLNVPIRTLVRYCTLVHLYQKDWLSWIDLTEFAINASISETTCFALFELNGHYMPSMICKIRLDIAIFREVQQFMCQALSSSTQCNN